MAAFPVAQTILASSVAFSFILVGKRVRPENTPPSPPPPPSSSRPRSERARLPGNAITQSFMAVPALLVDFPPPSSAKHQERATLLGRQWPVFWVVGNNFFRPISTFGAFGYAFTAFTLYRASNSYVASGIKGDWRLFAISALLHVTNVVHSAINMQPINDKLESLNGKSNEKDTAQAETFARSWIKGNYLRVVCPAIAGSIALFQTFF